MESRDPCVHSTTDPEFVQLLRENRAPKPTPRPEARDPLVQDARDSAILRALQNDRSELEIAASSGTSTPRPTSTPTRAPTSASTPGSIRVTHRPINLDKGYPDVLRRRRDVQANVPDPKSKTVSPAVADTVEKVPEDGPKNILAQSWRWMWST